LRDGFLHHAGGCPGVGDVGRYDSAAATHRSDLGSNQFEWFTCATNEGDIGASLGKSARNGAAQPAAATSDQGHLAVQSEQVENCHRITPLSIPD
jgi:hypothetical protein